jgi:predicted  nucleic acid-binding Zn-ribbon protein
MSGPGDLFREIRRLRRYAHELQEQIDRVPRQLKINQAKVTRQEDLRREGQEAVKHLRVATHDKEVSLRTTHQQIAKHQQQLNKAESKKEYDALQAEIAQERAACQRLEDEILQAMAEAEERTARLPELEQNVKRAREEYARYEQTSGERLAGLRGQLDDAQRQLAEAEAQLPADALAQYTRIVNALGPDALAAVQNRTTCSACHTEITAQNYNDVLQGRFVVCKSCGRILYLPESSRVEE